MMPSAGVVFVLGLAFAPVASALIPATPSEQTRRAITSIRDSISRARSTAPNSPVRLYVDYLLPLPPATTDADIDPWPGGLAQMYPYAEETLKEILLGVVAPDASDETAPVPDASRCSTQVISVEDCSGFFVQESPVSSSDDVAAMLFAGPDQYDDMKRIDEMVGDKRTLIMFNRQYARAADFGFFKKGEAQEKAMDRYKCGFAFQELACRGEDAKLTYECQQGWQSCMIDENGKEIALFDPMEARPVYSDLEKKINEVMPEPLWMRMIQTAQADGPKFSRDK